MFNPILLGFLALSAVAILAIVFAAPAFSKGLNSVWVAPWDVVSNPAEQAEERSASFGDPTTLVPEFAHGGWDPGKGSPRVRKYNPEVDDAWFVPLVKGRLAELESNPRREFVLWTDGEDTVKDSAFNVAEFYRRHWFDDTGEPKRPKYVATDCNRRLSVLHVSEFAYVRKNNAKDLFGVPVIQDASQDDPAERFITRLSENNLRGRARYEPADFVGIVAKGFRLRIAAWSEAEFMRLVGLDPQKDRGTGQKAWRWGMLDSAFPKLNIAARIAQPAPRDKDSKIIDKPDYVPGGWINFGSATTTDLGLLLGKVRKPDPKERVVAKIYGGDVRSGRTATEVEVEAFIALTYERENKLKSLTSSQLRDITSAVPTEEVKNILKGIDAGEQDAIFKVADSIQALHDRIKALEEENAALRDQLSALSVK